MKTYLHYSKMEDAIEVAEDLKSNILKCKNVEVEEEYGIYWNKGDYPNFKRGTYYTVSFEYTTLFDRLKMAITA